MNEFLVDFDFCKIHGEFRTVHLPETYLYWDPLEILSRLLAIFLLRYSAMLRALGKCFPHYLLL